jgi:ATP-dependent Clp protease adapter protein ClpS
VSYSLLDLHHSSFFNSDNITPNKHIVRSLASSIPFHIKKPITMVTVTAKLTLLLLSVLQLTTAFAPATFPIRRQTPAWTNPRTHPRPAFILRAGERDRDSGGGAAIAKPAVKTDQKTKTVQKEKVKQRQKAEVGDPVSRREDEFQEAPMFKLMLIGDASYDAAHVVERMCAVVDDMDEDQAATVLQQANQVGKAMCGKYPFEKAELFKEQLIRSDPMIFSDLESENK